jgi:hypothetical protein
MKFDECLLNALAPQIKIFACYNNMLCVRKSPTYYMLTNISDLSTIIHNPVFERAIVKLHGGCKKDLTATEKRQIGRFETSEDDDEEAVAAEGEPRNSAQMCWMSSEENMSACCNRPDNYRLTKHTFLTTYIVERLFSKAKLVLTNHRKSMNPRHLEQVRCLCFYARESFIVEP